MVALAGPDLMISLFLYGPQARHSPPNVGSSPLIHCGTQRAVGWGPRWHSQLCSSRSLITMLHTSAWRQQGGTCHTSRGAGDQLPGEFYRRHWRGPSPPTHVSHIASSPLSLLLGYFCTGHWSLAAWGAILAMLLLGQDVKGLLASALSAAKWGQ